MSCRVGRLPMGAFSSPSLCLFAVVVFAFQTFLLHRTFTFSLSVFPMSSIARGTCKSGFKIQQVLVNDRFKQKKVRYGSTKHRLDQAGRDSNPVNHISFLSPLLDAGYPPYVKDALAGNNILKPLLLYLPGFDGTVVAPFLQFPELGTTFDVRALSVDVSDRSTFIHLKDIVVDYVIQTTTRKGRYDQRPIYLIGESFGGLLACEVAVSLKESGLSRNLKGVILVNPATSYKRSMLAAEAPVVADLPLLVYPFAMLYKLVPLFLDSYQLPQLYLILSSKGLPSVIDTPEREAYMGRFAFLLPQVLKFLPKDTLKWRLIEWLEAGCQFVTSERLQTLGEFMRCLIVVGEADKALPSVAEAERLLTTMRQCEIHVVDGAGHASTCGSRVDLAAVIRNRFSELQAGSSDQGPVKRGRIEMKPVASSATGMFFGMEPRYDNAGIGLSPLKYWSNKYWLKAKI